MDFLSQIPQLTTSEMWGVLFVFVFEAFDMIVGVTCATIKGEFSSTEMRKGLGHKAVITLALMLSILAQIAAQLVGDLGFAIPIVLPVCTFIIIMEIGSVIETLTAAYPELDLSRVFEWFHTDKE